MTDSRLMVPNGSTRLIQACLNGGRTRDYHPKVPVSADEIAGDAVRAVRAGAAELHIHPRNEAGNESLWAVDDAVRAVRAAAPGVPVGVSTAAWIEPVGEAALAAIDSWRVLPDYASVNFSEELAPRLCDRLANKNIAVEAGVASIDDARRFVSLPLKSRIVRVLVELDNESEWRAARSAAEEILAFLAAAPLDLPVLLHGFEATVWPFVHLARDLGSATRVGLEDGRLLPDGSVAADNADLVEAAASIYRAAEQSLHSE